MTSETTHAGAPAGLALYLTPYCGYCHRVLHAAERLQVELVLLDIWQDQTARARLLEHRGRATVPVLSIPQPDGGHQLLPESRDIIAFLERYATDPSAQPAAPQDPSAAAATTRFGKSQVGKGMPLTNWLSSISDRRRK